MFGAAVVFIVTMLLLMNTGGYLDQSPDVTLGCTYDGDQNRLGVSVVDSRIGETETTAMWVLDGDGPVELRSGGETARGVWVHSPDVADVADLPLETGARIVVPNVPDPSKLKVLWVSQDTGNVFPVLEADDGSGGDCDTGDVPPAT